MKNLSTRVAALERSISPMKVKLAVWHPMKETLEEAKARAGMDTEEGELQIIIKLVGADQNHRWEK